MNSLIKVFEPSGDLDKAKGKQLRQEITDSLQDDANNVLLDLHKVTFVDSSGLGEIVLILKVVEAAGGKLFICSVSEPVQILFELTSMDLIFKTFANRDEFEKDFFSKQ